MFNDLKANTYFLYKDSVRSIFYFWLIYISFVVIFLITSAMTDKVTIALSVSIPTAIFTFIFGFLFVKETFPFMIKYGSTRQGYIITISIFTAVYSLIMVTLSQTMSFVLNKIIAHYQLTNIELQVFNDFLKTQFSTAQIVTFEFFVYLIIFTVSLLIGALYFRFGFLFGSVINITVILLFMTVEPLRDLLHDAMTYGQIGHDHYTPIALFVPPLIMLILFGAILQRSSV